MQIIQIQTWKVSFDPVATRQAYSVFASDPKDLCRCLCCANFDKSSPAIYPRQFLRLLDALGVDPRYPGEVVSYVQMPDGRIFYDGWFHFAGTVEPKSSDRRMNALEDEFKIGFSSESLAPGHVVWYLLERGFTVAQLDFETLVPWLMDEPHPGP